MSLYVETNKPLSLKDSDKTLYYMYSNSHDPMGCTYQKITTDYELDIAYKVYYKLSDDVDLL